MYPCELIPGQAEALLKSTRWTPRSTAWGARSSGALEAEDKLSFACEKAPTEERGTLAIRAAFNAIEAEFKAVTGAEKAEVVGLGGLHVVGTERHESRRVDNQLRGRAGRQGDPGRTRYFLSLEDNLFRIFGGDKIQSADERVPSGGHADRVRDADVSRWTPAQKKVETYFYDIRKQLFDYDAVLNSQREKLYFERRRALSAKPEDLQQQMLEYAEHTVDDIVAANLDPSRRAARSGLERASRTRWRSTATSWRTSTRRTCERRRTREGSTACETTSSNAGRTRTSRNAKKSKPRNPV